VIEKINLYQIIFILLFIDVEPVDNQRNTSLPTGHTSTTWSNSTPFHSFTA